MYALLLKTSNDGTTMTRIPNILNNQQSEHKYRTDISSYEEWEDCVASCISEGYPAIIDITSTKGNWLYSSSGHYICICGHDNTVVEDYTWIADLHPTYYGIYKCKSKDVYNVNMAHFRKTIIY